MKVPMTKSCGQCVTFAAALMICSMTSPVHAADLIVKIAGMKTSEGSIRVGLFNTSAGFPKKQLRGELIEAKPGTVTAVFKDVPAGTYAVSAFQDINGNEKLDTNSFGKPIEPYGFSRNARGMFGPPSFDEAAFNVGQRASTIEFKLK